MAKYLLKWYVTEPTYKDYKDFINKINYSYWRQMHKFDENGISFILIDLSNNEIIKQKDPLKGLRCRRNITAECMWDFIIFVSLCLLVSWVIERNGYP